MNSDEFRELINERYKECMMDCQVPTGALAELNRAEFFAYEQYNLRIELEKDNEFLKDILESIHSKVTMYYSQ